MRRLTMDDSGAVVADFALTISVVLTVIFAMFQFGIIFIANAGLQNAVGDAARLATLWPRRSQEQLAAQLTLSHFGLSAANLSTPTFTYGTSNGSDYVDISQSYNAQLNFAFFDYPTITLHQTRRAYLP